jgi:hypothetical protein
MINNKRLAEIITDLEKSGFQDEANSLKEFVPNQRGVDAIRDKVLYAIAADLRLEMQNEHLSNTSLRQFLHSIKEYVSHPILD